MILYKIVAGAWLACAIPITIFYVLCGSATADRAVSALIAWAFILGILSLINFLAEEEHKLAKDDSRQD